MTAHAGCESVHSKESHSTAVLCYISQINEVSGKPHLWFIVSPTALKVCQAVALLPPVGTNKALHTQDVIKVI